MSKFLCAETQKRFNYLTTILLAFASGCSTESTNPTTREAAKKTQNLDHIASLVKSWKASGDIDWQITELLARASKAAYFDDDEANQAFHKIGFHTLQPHIKDSMVVYIASRGPVTVVAFRGTDDLEDWIANLKIAARNISSGNIHSGFHDAYQSLQADIHKSVKALKPEFLWITGHSLGGALAVLCANDFNESQFKVDGLMTFGQPMLAKSDATQEFNSQLPEYQRWINSADIVPLIPPLFEHVGSFVWLTDQGIMREQNTSTTQTKYDLSSGTPPVGPPALNEEEFLKLQQKMRQSSAQSSGLKQKGPTPPSGQKLFPPIDDHSMDRYLKNIQNRGIPSTTDNSAPMSEKPASAGPPKAPPFLKPGRKKLP